MDLPAGALVDDKYRVVRLLGRGGMGEVYEVENVKVMRPAALKLLKSTSSADIVARFEAEAQAAGRAGSHRIVDVLDLGRTPEGLPYMVMELLEGETLRDELRRSRRMPPRRAAALLADALLGLEAAHGAGIVHRDLKPENVFVLSAPSRGPTGDQPLVKLLDFGVSKFASSDTTRPGTAAGVMIGTCWYMSPEQVRDARSADGRSDLYALGVMLYELLTGTVPFPGKSLQEMFFKIISDPPRDPREVLATVPDSLAEVALRALAKDPDDRFPNAPSMREHLVAFLEERPVLHLDLEPLEVPAGRVAQGETLAAGSEPSAPREPIELAEASPRRGNTPAVWRSLLSTTTSSLDGGGPTMPSGRPEMTPVPTSAPRSTPQPGPSSPPAPAAPVPREPTPPSTRAPAARVEEPPPSLPTPEPASAPAPPSSGPRFVPAAIALATPLPTRRAMVVEEWPRAPLWVGAVALVVIVVSLAIGAAFRLEVIGG